MIDKKNINLIKDDSTRSVIEYLMTEAQGKVIELSGAPTAALPLLQPNQWGRYGNDLWLRLENTLHKYSSDSQITVTGDA